MYEYTTLIIFLCPWFFEATDGGPASTGLGPALTEDMRAPYVNIDAAKIVIDKPF